MKLSSWIESEGGRVIVARRLRISPVTICCWFTGKSSPKITTMQDIFRISKGRVTYEEMIEETKPSRKSRRC